MTGLRPFKCDQCGKRFSRELNLAKHERVHTGIKPYVCKYCGKCFAQSADLKRHTSRIHTGEKPYSCDDGGKRFFNSSTLNEHKRLYGIERHTGPLKCEHCERRFRRKWDLSFHSHVHTGIRPYVCEYCDKGFVRPADLKRHTRIHTGDKPYSCDLCGKSFNDASVFRRHVKTIHRAEKPGDCGDVGQNQKHVEEKPFICKDCGTVMKFGCTTLTNVFTVTKLSDVKCFMKNHTVTLQ